MNRISGTIQDLSHGKSDKGGEKVERESFGFLPLYEVLVLSFTQKALTT